MAFVDLKSKTSLTLQLAIFLATSKIAAIFIEHKKNCYLEFPNFKILNRFANIPSKHT